MTPGTGAWDLPFPSKSKWYYSFSSELNMTFGMFSFFLEEQWPRPGLWQVLFWGFLFQWFWYFFVFCWYPFIWGGTFLNKNSIQTITQPHGGKYFFLPRGIWRLWQWSVRTLEGIQSGQYLARPVRQVDVYCMIMYGSMWDLLCWNIIERHL